MKFDENGDVRRVSINRYDFNSIMSLGNDSCIVCTCVLIVCRIRLTVMNRMKNSEMYLKCT